MNQILISSKRRQITMYDFRDEIVALAEKALHTFVRFRLKDMGIEDTWRIGIRDFVMREYDAHKANYEKIYVILQTHDEKDLILEQLDITALVSLVHFYWKSRGIYEVSPEATQLFINHVMELKELRNTFDHYTKELIAIDKSKIYFDQLYYVESLSGFATLVMKYKGATEEWKTIFHKAKGIEKKLWGERWLALDTSKAVLADDDDMSSILFNAEHGNVEAQVKAGKAYYHGDRVRADQEMAYVWIHKAALKGNAEAEYYLGLCFEKACGVEFNYQTAMEWFKKSAEHGCAPAQYQYGTRNWGKIGITEAEKKDIFYWNSWAADQNYPEAVWVLGLCYQMGIGCEVNKAKAQELIEKSAKLGYTTATEHLINEAEKNKDYYAALAWLKLLGTQGKKDVSYRIRRLERMVTESSD